LKKKKKKGRGREISLLRQGGGGKNRTIEVATLPLSVRQPPDVPGQYLVSTRAFYRDASGLHGPFYSLAGMASRSWIGKGLPD